MKSGKPETWTKTESKGEKTSAQGMSEGRQQEGRSRLSQDSAGDLFAPLHVAFEKLSEVASLHQGNELCQHLFGALLIAYFGLSHAGVSEDSRCQAVEGVGDIVEYGHDSYGIFVHERAGILMVEAILEAVQVILDAPAVVYGLDHEQGIAR